MVQILIHRTMKYRTVACVVMAFCLASTAFAQADAKDLDIPYVPTPQKVVDAMLAMGEVGPKDFLIDLGSGDGRMVITAAKQLGARGFGVEIDPRLVALANRAAVAEGVGNRVQFMEQDLFKTPLHEASVITMYLLPDVNIELRPRLLALNPGTRIVSHDYHLGEWQADAHEMLDVPDKPVGPLRKSDIYLWIVSAQVAGNWEAPMNGKLRGVRLELTQQYQAVQAKLTLEGVPLRVTRTTLRGRMLEVIAENAREEPFRLVLQAEGKVLTGVGRLSAGKPIRTVFNRH
ncbi:MAG: class I SAM-dependent methyltransferase [Betaproteobacteria bacterium]|nr:class I SAM-dependent methyltransferase [Betaproteobacteria bacterium]